MSHTHDGRSTEAVSFSANIHFVVNSPMRFVHLETVRGTLGDAGLGWRGGRRSSGRVLGHRSLWLQASAEVDRQAKFRMRRREMSNRKSQPHTQQREGEGEGGRWLKISQKYS